MLSRLNFINLAIKFFTDMRYYSVASELFVQDCIACTHMSSVEKKQSWIRSIWKLSHEDWTKT